MAISDKILLSNIAIVLLWEGGVGFHLKILSTYYIRVYPLKNRKKIGIPDFYIRYALCYFILLTHLQILLHNAA